MVYIMQDHVYTGSMPGLFVRRMVITIPPACCCTGSPGCAADLLGGHHDRATNSVRHRPLVGFVVTGGMSAADVITRTNQRPRPATLAGWSSPSE